MKKKVYIGRLTYFDIILKENLSTECNNQNCDLCFMNNKTFCINCKYNYTSFLDGTKNCSDDIKINIDDTNKIYSDNFENNNSQCLVDYSYSLLNTIQSNNSKDINNDINNLLYYGNTEILNSINIIQTNNIINNIQTDKIL